MPSGWITCASCARLETYSTGQVEAGIGDDDADEQLDQRRLVGQPAKHEDVERADGEPDEGQDEAEKQEARRADSGRGNRPSAAC